MPFIFRELSTTHYTVGSQLQDFAPLSRKSRPEVVRQIADHYAKSLKYCEIERTEEKSRIPIYQVLKNSLFVSVILKVSIIIDSCLFAITV